MDIDPAVLIRRLTGRRSCPNCGKVFNIHTAPSHKGDRCDNCDASPLLIQRDDDREEVIERRLRVYERDTRPLIDHYRARGLLRVVEAGGPVEQVYSDFLRAAGGA
jgi:adenylate kinase